MFSSFSHTVEGDYSVTVISVPLANQSDIFEFPAGSNLTLTCMVTPTPPSDSQFSWSCSTGCFVDMEIDQSVNITELEVTDSGELNCSVIIDDVEYTSESVELRVTGECNIWPDRRTFLILKVYFLSFLVIPFVFTYFHMPEVHEKYQHYSQDFRGDFKCKSFWQKGT